MFSVLYICAFRSNAHGTLRYSTVQYSTVQYSTVQYSTVQYSTVQYSTVQYSTVQYSTVQYSLATLHRIPTSIVLYGGQPVQYLGTGILENNRAIVLEAATLAALAFFWKHENLIILSCGTTISLPQQQLLLSLILLIMKLKILTATKNNEAKCSCVRVCACGQL
jgi:hypothetical protein